jgi:hypothetical protein
VTWLKTNRRLNKMYVRWLDKMEDLRFDATHLPGALNPTDPLSRRGFPDGDGPAAPASTGDADAENEPAGTLLATGRRRRCAGDAGHPGRPRPVGRHPARGGGDVR